MHLEEFIKDQKQLLDEFARTYVDGKSRGTYNTMFHPESFWLQNYKEFLRLQTENLNPELSEIEKHVKAA